MSFVPPVSSGGVHRALQPTSASPFSIARTQVAGLLHPTHATPPRCQPLAAATPASGVRIAARWERSAKTGRQLLVFVEKGHNLGRQIHAAYQGERPSTAMRHVLAAGEATSVAVAARRYPALQGMERHGEDMLAEHRQRLGVGDGNSGKGVSSNELNLRLLADRLAR